ncbi:outer membrane beta-barrel protein [Marinobacter fonticola]|uniref:outer membrane beta-barrel protein n=1 Tax=Marinobacter fonticola TaxID=2603215 RepID=UPI00143D5006|nr:outer membrane beta-barrel protein [Marinobacter fonticola]
MAVQAERTAAWDLSVHLLGNFHESSKGSNGSSLNIDSSVGLGLGGGYNFSEHLKLGAELSFLSPDYTANITVDGGAQQKIESEMEVFNGHLYGAWNFLEGPLTPYVRAGLGWTYVNSNIVSNEVPMGVCWWDPWWGYICSGFYDTYDDTRFSYGGGLGMRYELDNQYYIQGGVDRYEMSGEGLGASPNFELWRLEFGWRFSY